MDMLSDLLWPQVLILIQRVKNRYEVCKKVVYSNSINATTTGEIFSITFDEKALLQLKEAETYLMKERSDYTSVKGCKKYAIPKLLLLQSLCRKCFDISEVVKSVRSGVSSDPLGCINDNSTSLLKRLDKMICHIALRFFLKKSIALLSNWEKANVCGIHSFFQ